MTADFTLRGRGLLLLTNLRMLLLAGCGDSEKSSSSVVQQTSNYESSLAAEVVLFCSH